MSPTDKDVVGNLLNSDRAFGVLYKARARRGRGLGAWGAPAAVLAGPRTPARLPARANCTRGLRCSACPSLPANPQDFITGPANDSTNGYFGVDVVTGEGYAFATDAWADAPKEPTDGHCIDSWTLAPVKVPIAGAALGRLGLGCCVGRRPRLLRLLHVCC